MNKKILLAALVGALILAGVIVAITSAGQSQTSGVETTETASSHNSTDAPSPEGPEASILNQAPPESQDHLESAVLTEVVDATGQSEVSVEIGDYYFNPSILRISPGTTVTWTNEGNIRHSVNSADDSPSGPESELLANGESYEFTFDEVGVYNYLCDPHPTQMRAVVEVVEEVN